MSDPDPDLIELVASTVTKCMATKEGLVAMDGIGTDLLARVEVHRDGKPFASVPLIGEKYQRDRILWHAVAISAADLVVFIGEAFTYTPMPGKPHPTGSYAKAFADGVEGTHEVIIVGAFDNHGETVSTVTPYRYEGRAVHWGPPLDMADDASAPIAAIVADAFLAGRAMVEEIKERPTGFEFAAALAMVTDIAAVGIVVEGE